MSGVSNSSKKAICSRVDALAEPLHSLSQDIWSHPELCFEEHHAHASLTRFLGEHCPKLQVEPHYILKTGFRATYESAPRPHAVIICEYDALPEIGHACGHNLISEVGAGAGLAVQHAMETCGLKGKLTILGTPAEEGGCGKAFMIDEGIFQDVDFAVMAHPFRFTQIKVELLSLTQLTARYTGKASHAAGYPWEGVNALDAAVMAYQSISCMRQQMKPTWRIHGIFSDGGQKPNIIPERAELVYYLRCPTDKELVELRKKTIACFKGAADMTGCSVDIKEMDKPYSNVISNDPLAEVYERNARALGVEFTDPATNMPSGSTDMGNVSHVVPSIHPMFYVGGDVPPHSQGFAAIAGSPDAQPATLLQAKALAATVVEVMENPSLLEGIRAQFQKDLQEN